MNARVSPGGRVEVVEVGPRDGFQMEAALIPTDLKVEVIDLLSSAGLTRIEATSFVSPKAIPQMADAEQVMARIERRPGTVYGALVPNLKGAERALNAGADSLRLVICASETYNRRNVGVSVAESMALVQPIAEMAAADGAGFEVVIGLAFGCPFEGDVPEDRVIGLARQLVERGVEEISLADSIGTANPAQVWRMCERARRELEQAAFSLHLHDTRGLALANVLSGIDAGIARFDAGLGGMGGCPVFEGASGNVATEDLVNMLEEIGLATGVDLSAVREASSRVQRFLGRALPSRILRVGTRQELFAKAAVPS